MCLFCHFAEYSGDHALPESPSSFRMFVANLKPVVEMLQPWTDLFSNPHPHFSMCWVFAWSSLLPVFIRSQPKSTYTKTTASTSSSNQTWSQEVSKMIFPKVQNLFWSSSLPHHLFGCQKQGPSESKECLPEVLWVKIARWKWPFAEVTQNAIRICLLARNQINTSILFLMLKCHKRTA